MNPALKFWIIGLVVLVALWDGIWKVIAMWKSARNGQLAWYVCLTIFNTAGILPILYILVFQKTGMRAPPRQT